MFDRNERFTRIRRELLEPLPQKPSPDTILSKMLQMEQTLNLKLTNTRQSWSLVPYTFSTVAGQTNYEIPAPVSGNNTAGKIYAAFRATNEVRLPSVPVPFEDFSGQSFGAMPENVNRIGYVPEQISVYRNGLESQKLNVILQPSPKEVMQYTLYFYPGAFDRAEALMSASGILSELTDYVDLKTAISLLPACEWQGYAEDRNLLRKNELRNSFLMQLEDLTPIVEEYVDQIGSPSTFEMGHWNG